MRDKRREPATLGHLHLPTADRRHTSLHRRAAVTERVGSGRGGGRTGERAGRGRGRGIIMPLRTGSGSGKASASASAASCLFALRGVCVTPGKRFKAIGLAEGRFIKRGFEAEGRS